VSKLPARHVNVAGINYFKVRGQGLSQKQKNQKNKVGILDFGLREWLIIIGLTGDSRILF